MSLGFALVHPQRLSTTLGESIGEKIGWDDGADLTLAAAGIDLGDDPLGRFLAQLQTEALELLGELQGLFLPGGPFQSIKDTFSGEGDGVVAWLRRIGDFLAGVEPLHLKALLAGHVDAFFDHFSAFDLTTLDDRLRRLAQQALDVLRGPLLGGRDDGAAHRAFRAAALMLARLEPLFQAVDAGLAPFDVRAAIKARLLAAIDGLPRALLDGFAQVGRILRDDIAGMVEASASFSISVGPSGLVSGVPSHRDDADPQPFQRFGHWLWWVDAISSFVSLFWSVWGFQRARGLKRPTEWIEFLLASGWHIFRDAIRLLVQPAWLSKDSSGFVRMLFSEWGDLFVRFVLMLVGSIEDMVAWSNFVMGFGNRFLKWFALELQPRLVYQFCRSIWYLRSWHDDPNPATRGDPRFSRVIWAGWAPMLLVIAIMGLCLPGESYDLQAFGATNHEWATAGLVLALIFQIAGSLVMPWILMGEHPFRRYSYDSYDFIALSVATFLVMFIGVETLGSTNVGATTADVLRWVLYIVFGATLGMVVLGQCFSGASSDGSARWFEVVGAVQGWLVGIVGSLGTGLVTMLVWWFFRRDGEDQNNDFEGLDAATSPYFLPFPRDDMWFCGQGFHGIFSHTWRSAHDPPWRPKSSSWASDNLYAYDFNNAFGKPACVARAGVVRSVNVGNVDGGSDQNSVEIQHWDWVPGHDPGTDLERELNITEYLHLAQNRARCAVGQFVSQGYNLAAIDDTGTSALNHLHVHVYATLARMRPPMPNATPAPDNVDVTMPMKFRDSDARGFRSFGHIDGKPKSLAYYASENVGAVDAEVTTSPLAQTLTLTANAVPPVLGAPAGHTHTLVIGADLLGTSGLPATLTLVSSQAAGHAHSATLTAEQLRSLLARGTGVQTDAAFGPIVDLTSALTAAPTLVSHQHELSLAGASMTRRSLPLVTPPGGRLIADAIAPLDLVGTHVAIDADGQAANHWLLGAHRPVIAADLALDRGPTGDATILVSGTPVPGPTAGAALSSARLAAGLWSAAWGNPFVARPEPVIVLESRARGTAAQVLVSGPGLGVWNVTGALASNGSGALADLGTASVALLVPVVQAALAAGAGALPLSTSAAGATLEIRVAGAPVSSFAGSSSRIAAVLPRAYDAASARLRSDGALPLSAGHLSLDGNVVPILAAPARLRLDATSARLEPATLLDDPLVLTVLGATHTLWFRFADRATDTPDTLDLVASRITSDVDGVRAWRDGNAVIVETVAAGSAVTLQAVKNAFDSGPVTGAAPTTSGVSVRDTTALTPAELESLIDDARSRAARPAAPVVSVTATGVDVVVSFSAGIPTPTVDASFGWIAVLTAAPDASSSAVLRLTPPAGMPDPMWADISADGASFRIAVDASAARIDLAPLARAATAADTLTVTTAAGSRTVSVPPGTSLVAQLRAFAEVPGLSARLAYRWRIENQRFQSGDLRLAAGVPSALPGMGLFTPPATQRSAGPAAEMVRVGVSGLVPGTPTVLAGIVGGSPEDDAPAFTAAVASNQVTLTPHADMTLSVSLIAPALPVDPTGLTASGATLVSVPIAAGLITQQALVWQVSVLRDGVTLAQTLVQLAAAPAIARAASVAGAAWTDTAGASLRAEVVAERATLTITVTIPGSPDVDVEMPVDLVGAGSMDEVVARITREAPLAEAFLIGNVLQIQTRGAGSGWGLRLEGARTLASLGYDPTRFAADLSVQARGAGQLRDLQTASADDLAAAFTAGAAAAAWPRALHYRVAVSGSTIQLRTLGAPLVVSAEPQRLLDVLAPAAVPGGVDIAVPAPLDLDQGWIKVMQGSELRHVVSVVGSRAAVEASDPLPSVPGDVATLLGTIAGQTLQVDIDSSSSIFNVPAGLTSIDALLAAMIRQLSRALVRLITRADGVHLEIASRRRGSTSRVVVTSGGVANALGFQSQLDSNGGGRAPGLGSFDDLANVAVAPLASALAERPVEAGQGVLAAAATTTGVTLTPFSGQIQWTSPPGYITSAASDPGASTLWTSANVATPFQGPTLTHAWSGRAPLVSQLLLFRVVNAFPGSGAALLDRTLIAALWANPARLGPFSLPADLAALEGQTLRLVLEGANVDITFNGLTALPPGQRPAALVATIEGAAVGRVRARVDTTALRIESSDDGSTVSMALGVAPANDARALLGNPAPVSATGTGNVGALSAVAADEIAALVRAAFVVDGDLQQNAQWNTRNPDNLGPRLSLSSQKAGCASAVIPAILPAVLRMRRALQRGPAHGAAVVLPALDGDVSLDGSLFITLNGGNGGPRAVPATTVEVRFAAGNYSPRRVWLRIDEELRGRGVGRAGLYPDGASGFRIAIESRLPGLQGSVKVPADAPPSTPDVVSRLVGPDVLFGRGWPGIGGTTPLARATRGLRTTNSLAVPVAGRTWAFTASGGAAAVPFRLGAADASLAQLAARLDALIAPAGIGIARLHELDGCVYVELIDTGASTAVFDGSGPPASTPATAPTFGLFGQPALPATRVGGMGDMWVDTGLQLRVTELTRTCRLVAFVFDGTATPRLLDPGWVRLNPDVAGSPNNTPFMRTGRFGILIRSEASRSDNYSPAGDMLVSTGTATIDGTNVSIVHQARYWFTINGDDGLAAIALPSGEVVVEVLHA